MYGERQRLGNRARAESSLDRIRQGVGSCWHSARRLSGAMVYLGFDSRGTPLRQEARHGTNRRRPSTDRGNDAKQRANLDHWGWAMSIYTYCKDSDIDAGELSSKSLSDMVSEVSLALGRLSRDDTWSRTKVMRRLHATKGVMAASGMDATRVDACMAILGGRSAVVGFGPLHEPCLRREQHRFSCAVCDHSDDRGELEPDCCCDEGGL